MYKTGIVWLSNDLRLTDNRLFADASRDCESLLVVYIRESASLKPNRYGFRSLGKLRRKFIDECLSDLNRNLTSLGSELFLMEGSTLTCLQTLIGQYRPDVFYCATQSGFYENDIVQFIRRSYPELRLVESAHTTLLDQTQLPFLLADIPKSFTQFRKKVEPIILDSEFIDTLKNNTPSSLPKQPQKPTLFAGNTVPFSADLSFLNDASKTEPAMICGGETHAQQHLKHYFSNNYASTYKQTRNKLDGIYHSTKFSPWLSQGCISPKQILKTLVTFEQNHGANESTYWIKFELLWREYFFWLAKVLGKSLYLRGGYRHKNPLKSFYPQRLKSWCSGTTPYPLVNACMTELNTTGYLSNRGRQIVASCLVNEFDVDWRYGAAYFEQQLIDYDVASNWGNWQYIAGVGVDPRGGRHFDIDKQQRLYDPENRYCERWLGEHGSKYSNSAITDYVDAADWPLE
ncbi:DASH family cryptochrome [Sessilibacter sp. MAH4]